MKKRIGLVIVASACAAHAGTVYKSVGPDGRIVYSDRPPAGSAVEKTLDAVFNGQR